MRKALMVCSVVSALVLGGGTLLWAPDPGDPGDPGKPCSPGYWKNHEEVWNPDLCAASGDCDQIRMDLRAKGPGSGAVRHAASGTLNSRWIAAYGAPLPCND